MGKVKDGAGTYTVLAFGTVTLLFAVGASSTASSLAEVSLLSPIKALAAFVNTADEIGPAFSGESEGSDGDGAASDTQDA